MTKDSVVPISDMFDLIQKIEYIEDKTVDKLLKNTVSDLKGDRSIYNLKALNYFLLFRSNIKEISIYSYENVIHQSIDLLYNISDKDAVICALLGSVIENCLPLISKTNITKVLLKLVEFVESNLNFTEGKAVEKIDSNSNLTHSLQILEVMCCFLSVNPNIEFQFPYSLNSALISLIPKLTIEAARKIFVSVLTKFVLFQDSRIFLEQIWVQIISIAENENSLSKQLFYICLLCDHFIMVTPYKFCFPLHNETAFWEIIHAGLYNEDSTIRKQSAFLLKLYIEKLKEEGVVGVVIEQNLFIWDNRRYTELISYWRRFFILLEASEEKQTHLVTPALICFAGIHFSCIKKREVHYAWLYCVLIRFLKHPSHTIVKRALIEFTSIAIDVLFNDLKRKILLNCFFNALNNMVLFSVDKNPESNFNHEKLLEEWFILGSRYKSSTILFECILEHIASISWSPVPLFFISSAISKLPPLPLFNNNCLNHFKRILLVSLKNQNIYIRSAIQCRLLKCISNLTNNGVDIMAITDILGLFSSKESLKRGTGIWQKCVEWIENIPPHEVTPFFRVCSNKIFQISEGVEISIPIHSFGRMLVLITDSNKFGFEEDLKVCLDSLFEQFYECDKRIYSCLKVQDNCLEFFHSVFNEYNSFSNCNQKENTLIYFIEKRIINLLDYIEVRLRKGPIESMQIAKLYEKTFYEIINNVYLASKTSDRTVDLFKTALHSLTLVLTSFHEYFSLKIIFHCCSYLVKNDKNWRNTILEKDMINIFKKCLFSKNLSHMPSTVDPLINKKGKFISEIKHTTWCIFNFYLENNSNLQVILEEFPISMLIASAFNAVNNDGKQSLVPILKSFVYLLPLHKNFEEVKKFISVTWYSCFELRKTEMFWLALNEWMRMVFQDGIALKSVYHQVISDYAEKIMDLGGGLTGLVDILFNHCQKLSFIPQFSAIFSKGLVFGVILRKDKRMELDVSHYIMKQIESGSMESFGSQLILKSDSEVRIRALHLLLTISNVEHRNLLIVKVVQELLLFDEDLTKNKKRYFNDSLIHRKKNKLLQALLILENYIYLNASSELQDLPEMIYSWTLQSLISCSQQPSIRYQLEWLFMRLTIHYRSFQDSFWENFTKAGNERLGSMCSFISIAYHLAVILREDEFVELSVDYILPWCMSQNFNIRLYAQVLLSKLWDLFPEVSLKYNCITKNQWKIYEQAGNMFVNAKKMENDFYFSVFHPLDHFNVQTIYWDLPRLSNISEEEWIHPDILQKYSSLCVQNVSTDPNKSLASCKLPVWIINNAAKSDDSIVGSNIQKKFVPSKNMVEEHYVEDAGNKKDGLILVASLIDKASNLGGLARTCEVFAAKELVVSNLDVTKEKEFTSLSMTAEKHLRMTEVKSFNLAEYLKIMKKMGYKLIGAEQTTDSVSLASYHFPSKCVLLLGSEKEGIPANLLPLLEEYIEIPQLGLLRSLNVHVTGAIFLWEYSKQHSLSDKKLKK